MSFNQIPCPFIIPFSTRAHNSQVLPYILWNIRSLLFLEDFSTQFFRLVYHVELRNRLFFACTMNNTKITINSFAQFLHDTFGGTFIFKRDYRTHLQYTDISWISRIFSQIEIPYISVFRQVHHYSWQKWMLPSVTIEPKNTCDLYDHWLLRRNRVRCCWLLWVGICV